MINIVLTDKIRALSPYFSSLEGENAIIPDKPFIREILEEELHPEFLTAEELQKCIATCVYFGLDATQITRELFLNISRTRETFEWWFLRSDVPPPEFPSQSGTEMNSGLAPSETSLASIKNDAITWSVGTHVEEPVRSELIRILGSNLNRQKLLEFGCRFLRPPRKEISFSVASSIPDLWKNPSLRGSGIKSFKNRKGRLSKICALLGENQDAQARQLAEQILREIKSEVKIPEIESLRSRTNPISAELQFDREIFRSMDFDDVGIPIATTPEGGTSPKVKSKGKPRSDEVERKHRSIIEQMWSNPIHPEDVSEIISNTVILAALFSVRESTVVRMHVRMRRMAPVISLIYCVCIIVSFLTFFGAIVPEYSFIVLASYPILFARISLMNLHLVKRLLHKFEVWFLLLQVFLEFFCLIDMLRGDARCIGAIFLILTQLIVIFYDATLMAPRVRIVNLMMDILSAIIIIISLYAGLWKCKSRTISFGGITSTTENIFSQRVLIIAFFSIKHLVSVYWYPDCFVILTSRLSKSSERNVHPQNS